MRTFPLLALLALGALPAGCAANAATDKPAGPTAAAIAKGSARTNDFPVKIANKDGSVTAWFDGEKPPSDLSVPLVFGTSRLSFVFKGDKTRYEFKPRGNGELAFSDWSFEIFSPDGKNVLLLQDRFGPYHVVSTETLKAYLQGKAEPDRVVREPIPTGPTSAAVVHTGAKWISNTEFEYQVGGEKLETRKASLTP